MSKIFLDIGCHIGQSVVRFHRDVKDACDWHIICFDPLFNPEMGHHIDKKYINVISIKAAVGIEDCGIDIFPVPDGWQGSTTIKGKMTGCVRYDKPVSVTCIDIVRWFDEFIKEDDFVIVKMNIEGGEYALMPRLPEILPKIAGLHIKLHHSKFEPDEQAKMKEIYKDFEKAIQGIKTYIICDPTEKPYNFKSLVEQARNKNND